MARIQYPAIASKHPETMAAFMQPQSGFTAVRPLDNPRARDMVLSDGSLNISILDFRPGRIGKGLGYEGLHHFGVCGEDVNHCADTILLLGCSGHAAFSEDANEVTDRTKRSDIVHVPVGTLFGVADQPCTGAVPATAAEYQD